MNKVTKRLYLMLIAAILIMSFSAAPVSATTYYDEVNLKSHMSKSSITVRKGDKIVIYVYEKGDLVKPYKVDKYIHKGWVASMKRRSRSFKITAKRVGQTFIYFRHNGKCRLAHDLARRNLRGCLQLALRGKHAHLYAGATDVDTQYLVHEKLLPLA